MKHDETADHLASRLRHDGLAIFLFHGVITADSHRVRNYTRKHITADVFARYIRAISHRGRALSMEEVLAYCDNKEQFPPNSFAVTFDDGFENNLSVAAPILSDHGVPATIYVTSGFIAENGMSWIDRIELAVENTGKREIAVSWVSEPFSLRDSADRISFLKAVRQHVKSNRSCNPNQFADELCDRLGSPGLFSSNDPLDLKMTWDQVREAHESSLLRIGAHSHTHAILSFLDAQDLAYELDMSLGLLRDRAGIDPTHFSYPEGLAHCYSDTVIAELKERGVRCSPTAIDGINRSGADPFHLRRIMVT